MTFKKNYPPEFAQCVFHKNNINISILKMLANSIAAVINTSKLTRIEEIRSRIAESFQNIVEQFSTSFNLDDLLKILL